MALRRLRKWSAASRCAFIMCEILKRFDSLELPLISDSCFSAPPCVPIEFCELKIVSLLLKNQKNLLFF